MMKRVVRRDGVPSARGAAVTDDDDDNNNCDAGQFAESSGISCMLACSLSEMLVHSIGKIN